MTKYEVKVYAVTQSVAREKSFINGAESPPEVRKAAGIMFFFIMHLFILKGLCYVRL